MAVETSHTGSAPGPRISVAPRQQALRSTSGSSLLRCTIPARASVSDSMPRRPTSTRPAVAWRTNRTRCRSCISPKAFAGLVTCIHAMRQPAAVPSLHLSTAVFARERSCASTREAPAADEARVRASPWAKCRDDRIGSPSGRRLQRAAGAVSALPLTRSSESFRVGIRRWRTSSAHASRGRWR
jgi:hypothetical protein